MTFTIPFPTPALELKALRKFHDKLDVKMLLLTPEEKLTPKYATLCEIKCSCLKCIGTLALKHG